MKITFQSPVYNVQIGLHFHLITSCISKQSLMVAVMLSDIKYEKNSIDFVDQCEWIQHFHWEPKSLEEWK